MGSSAPSPSSGPLGRLLPTGEKREFAASSPSYPSNGGFKVSVDRTDGERGRLITSSNNERFFPAIQVTGELPWPQ
jgi:hypothetical protein